MERHRVLKGSYSGNHSCADAGRFVKFPNGVDGRGKPKYARDSTHACLISSLSAIQARWRISDLIKRSKRFKIYNV
jgi:hypothetical protein